MGRITNLCKNLINNWSSYSSPPNATTSDSIVEEKDSTYRAVLSSPCTTSSDWIAIEKDATDEPILSSPCLVLSQKEAIIDEVFRPRTFMGRCLYDLGTNKFVPADLHPKERIKSAEEDEEMLMSEDSECFGSSHGWLAFFNPNSCLLYLMNPLTLRTIPLPPLETLPGFISPCFNEPCAEDLAGDKRFTSVVAFKCLNDEGEEYFVTPKCLYEKIIGKIVLSSPPDIIDSAHECCVMMVFHGVKSGLAFCRTGDTSWTNLVSNDVYEDVIYSEKNRKFYCTYSPVVEDGIQIDVWDLDSSPYPEKTTALEWCEFFPHDLQYDSFCVCLVESSGELFLVERYFADQVGDGDQILSCDEEDLCFEFPRKTSKFDVFKVDLVEQKLNYINCIGDQAFFLGSPNGFSLAASDYPEIKANCIYFTDSCTYSAEGLLDFKEKNHSNFGQTCVYKGHYFGVYNLEDSSISPCYQTENKNLSHVPLWLEPYKLVRN